MMAQRMIFAVILALMLTQAAKAQRIITALSEIEISVDANFTGDKLTLFGNVEPAFGEAELSENGPFDIIMVIEGPPATHTVRQKTQRFGIWLNSDGATFTNTPGFYYVLSSRDPALIANSELLKESRIYLEEHIRESQTFIEGEVSFLVQLQRLMAQANLYGVSDRGVQFLSPTFYRTQLDLPANVPNGSFLAKSYLFANGELLDERATRFVVRTAGIERFLERSALDHPWLYGISCVLLALFTGWVGSVAFRR